MEDFKDICAAIVDKYPLRCEVEEYFADQRITKAIFRVMGVGEHLTWATIAVPTKQAGDPLVKRFIRAHILAHYAFYGGDDLRDEAAILLKGVVRDARRNNSLHWLADRAETLHAELTEQPV